MKSEERLSYVLKPMGKEAFFYAYKELAATTKEHILLESGRDGKYSIAGVRPLAKIEALKNEALVIHWRDGRIEVLEGDPLQRLTEFIARFEVETDENLPPFQGGLMGFISYDYVRRFEQLPDETKDVLVTPDLYFYLFDEWAVHDIESETVYFMTLQSSSLNADEVADKWLAAAERTERQGELREVAEQLDAPEVSVTGEAFEQMVRDVQVYIEKGEVTQVNLSVRQAKPLTVSSLSLYETLRKVNPSPYMASIGAENFDVASSSPELLIKRRGTEIETRPIGGTRKRGLTEAEDLANEADLLATKKEVAEHLMLVELEKEDFAKVCVEDTVEANELLVIERYSHVMHLVSNIRGSVRTNMTNADIIQAVFPGGTITGAPKLRTMEIIEELEPEKRGLYTGSIGWLGFNGDLELNVVIRTAFIQNGKMHVQAGAGLTDASDPHDEYVESIAKGRALWQAKEIAESN